MRCGKRPALRKTYDRDLGDVVVGILTFSVSVRSQQASWP
jgi:hypothetical protein